MVLAVIAFALINALIRPVILFALASISTVAVIVATFVFQILVFYLVEWLLPGFEIERVTSALFGSIFFAVFNTILAAIFSVNQNESYYGALVAQLARRRPDRIETDLPGRRDHPDRRPGPPDPRPPDPGRSRAVHLALGAQPRDAPRQVDGAPALADLGQPGRHPARQQQLHPGLPLVGEGPPDDDGLEPPGGRRRDRPARVRRRGPAVQRRRQRRQPRLRRRRPLATSRWPRSRTRARAWATAEPGTPSSSARTTTCARS